MAQFERRNFLRCHGLLDGFAFLANDQFAGITNTFALVWLRWIISADIGSHLTNQLSVDAFDCDLGGIGNRDLNALRDRKKDVV